MSLWLKQSTAVTIKFGPFVDSTDGVTAETALTISQADIRLSKNGGDAAQTNNAAGATHDENGYYDVPLNATDTNTLGTLRVFVNESGALPVWQDFMVVAANVYDSLIGGGDVLDVSVTQWLGTAAATPTVAGVPEVDLTHIGGDAQSGTDLKDFADAGYDPATNKVEGVKTADALTTNNDKTGYSLSAAAIQAIWDALTSALTTVGSIGKKLADWVLGSDNKVILSNNAHTGAVVPTVTTLTGHTPQTGDSFARIGAAGAGLTAVPWNAAWDPEVESEATDALNAYDPPTRAEATSDKNEILSAINVVSGTADSGSTTTMVDAARTEADADYWKGALIRFTSGNIAGQTRIITDFDPATDTITFAPPTSQAVGTNAYVIISGISVWDDTLAEHLISGSTGAALNAAGAAGDPWSTAIPGAYGAGTAGKIVGDNLNAKVGDVKTKTDTLPADPASQAAILAKLPAALVGGRMASNAEVVGDKAGYDLSAAGNAAVADKLLGRTRAGGADGGRTVAQCLAFGRNKWEIAGGTLTVYADDDTTPLYTAAVATAAGDPITSVDPV